ncbi:restriction endonuclease [Halocatena salina]|uniref:Restriction endonuclease n=1 Tax=Halocatena salina TaxID=2934340 RepID=A0A8U0A0A6_9EURY|nr:restriction endonuclease [Halocatena salina]UPM41848.1 restriction endonuclease [Halocatena salina]
MGDDGNRFSSLLGGDTSGGRYEWGVRALYDLSPSAFERVVGALYIAEGYEVERAGPTVEGGIDLIAKKSGFIRSKTVVISIIPPGGTVSLPTVKQLERGRGINGAKVGILVRPKPFRDEIRRAATDNGAIELLDGQQLTTRLTDNGVAHPGR